MNILVTGSNGQLGNEMRLVSKDSTNRYIFTDIIDSDKNDTVILDIRDIKSIRDIVKKENIEAIINCAAYTNVDKAESDKELCEELNSTAVENLAIVMNEVNGLLVHISTDYVFGGHLCNTPCNEEEEGTPTGVYGLTKLKGENKIKESSNNYIIIRTSWLYSEFGKNFVKTMINLTSTKPQLKVVFDQVGTPTYAYDLASVIYHIVENKLYEGNKGIYHYSNEGVCSWYDFTKKIAELIGNDECDIQPCKSDEFPSNVKRPPYSVLDKTKIKKTFGITVPYWTDSLKKCINNLKLS